MKTADNKQLQVAPKGAAERFRITVERKLAEGTPEGLAINEKEKQLIQHYFIGIDRALKEAETRRIRQNENNRDKTYNNDLAYVWNNVDLEDLAIQVVDNARWGLDILMKNHIFAIPFKDHKNQKYVVNLMLGYNGIKMKALNYAKEIPVDVTIELVKENDHFKPLKKDSKREVENYEFEITDVWNRGSIVGGFGYLIFEDPRKNKLIIMSKHEIEKRKPEKASAEFWGGERKVWEKGEYKTEEHEGWYEEMCLKTLIREVFSEKHLPLDTDKVDEAYDRQIQREIKMAELQAQEEIAANANKQFLDFKDVTPEEEFAEEEQLQEDHSIQTPIKQQDPAPVPEQESEPEAVPEYVIPSF